MKYKPKDYAKSLLETETNHESIARFWYTLQKNRQYRDLVKILDGLDTEFARKNNLIFAKIFSSSTLDTDKVREISNKLNIIYKKDIILKQIIKQDVTGIIVRVEDEVIDNSAETKIHRLKKTLAV